MGPNETGPQGVDSIEICLPLSVKQDNTTITVGVNEPNFVPVADTDEACKTLEGYISASADENGELEPNLEIDGEDRCGELSNSIDINGDDQNTVCDDENSGNSQACGYESAYSAEPEPNIEASDVIKNRSDMELDYEMYDPLEFARQVAIEVEREVEDCEEESLILSSSDKAPESVSKLNEPESGARVQPEPESENLADEPVANEIQEIKSSQVVNVNQSFLSDDAEKSVCDFDLNEEVRVEKIDDLENKISTPIAATRMAVSSKQREDCLDFDLNIHESSVEPDVEAPEKLNLDLNCSAFEEQIQHLSIGYHNLSSSSSKNTIDLNDQPSFVSEHYGTSVANDSVISIMGVKVVVNKSNSEYSNSYAFTNGWDPMPPVDVNLSLFGTESAVHVYNDLTSSIDGSMSTPMYEEYGQFDDEYVQFDEDMFDSPQTEPLFHYPHLMMGMNAGMDFMPESNEVIESSDLSLNLNTGSVFDGNRENGGSIRQYSYTPLSLNLNTVSVFDGNRENGGSIRQYSSTPQTTNLIAGMMKRREPESGWGLELFPLKRHQPTWK